MSLTLTGLLILTTAGALPPEPTRPPSIVQVVPVPETQPPRNAPPADPKVPGLPPLPKTFGPGTSGPPTSTRPTEVLEPQPRTGKSDPTVPVESDQLDKHFSPTAGVHDLTFVHPSTRKNVDVTFRLPDLPLKRFEVNKRQIHFDYGRKQVILIFRITGQVDVRYE